MTDLLTYLSALIPQFTRVGCSMFPCQK